MLPRFHVLKLSTINLFSHTWQWLSFSTNLLGLLDYLGLLSIKCHSLAWFSSNGNLKTQQRWQNAYQQERTITIFLSIRISLRRGHFCWYLYTKWGKNHLISLSLKWIRLITGHSQYPVPSTKKSKLETSERHFSSLDTDTNRSLWSLVEKLFLFIELSLLFFISVHGLLWFLE